MTALNAVGQLFIAAKATEARHTRLPQPIRYPRLPNDQRGNADVLCNATQRSQWYRDRNAVKDIPNWGIPDDTRLHREAVHARFSFLTPIASGSS